MNIFKQPVLLLRGIVALLYVVLGTYLTINSYYLYFVSRNYRIGLALLILVYGLFRLYRFFKEYKDLSTEDE